MQHQTKTHKDKVRKTRNSETHSTSHKANKSFIGACERAISLPYGTTHGNPHVD